MSTPCDRTAPPWRARPALVGMQLGLVLLAFALRAHHLGGPPLELDEAFSVRFAALGLAGIVEETARGEPHPPLYYAFLNVWYEVAGRTELALRFPSLLLGVLTVAGMARLGVLLGWRAAGLLGALLFALNPYQLYYAQNVRMYAPAAAFSLLAVCFAVRYVRRSSWSALGLQGLAIALALGMHYFAAFVWVFLNALVLGAVRGAALRRWVAVQAAIGLLLLAWLAFVYRIVVSFKRGPQERVTAASLFQELRDALWLYSVGVSVPEQPGRVLALGFLVLVAVGVFYAAISAWRRRSWVEAAVALGFLAAPVGLGFLVSLVRTMYQPRYLMVGAPGFFLLLGLGVLGLWKVARPLGAAAAALLIAAQILGLRAYFAGEAHVRSDVADGAAYVLAHLRPGDGIVLNCDSQLPQFWYAHSFRGGVPAPYYLLPEIGAEGFRRLPEQLDGIMARHRGVWFLDYGARESCDRDRAVERELARRYYPVLYQPVGRHRIAYYAAEPATPPRRLAMEGGCGEELRFFGGALGGPSVAPGEVVPMWLGWRVLRPSGRDYRLSWRLLDAQGHVVVQHDAAPHSGFSSSGEWRVGQDVVDRYGMPLPTFLLPGDYRVGVAVYDQAGGACAALAAGEPRPGGLIPLGELLVAPDPVAGVGDPPPGHPVGRTLGRLELLGYDVAPGPHPPGSTVPLRLHWRSSPPAASLQLGSAETVVPDSSVGRNGELVAARIDAASPGAVGDSGTPSLPVLPIPEYGISVELRDGSGAVVQQIAEPLGPPGFPTPRWQAGRVLATYLDLRVPPRATTGAYEVALALTTAGRPVTGTASIGGLAVVARERVFTAPSGLSGPSARFGGAIELVGHRLEGPPTGELRPGDAVDLTLVWRARGEPEKSYKVFTQLLGPDGQVRGQDDALPLRGAAPTNGWTVGEVVTDRYRLTLRSGSPSGPYRLIVGFYDPASGERLRAHDGSDHVELFRLRVDGPGMG